MSEPLHAWRGENEEPRPDLIPDKQPAGDSDHADHGTRTNDWFHRTASAPPSARSPAPGRPRRQPRPATTPAAAGPAGRRPKRPPRPYE